MGAVGIKEAASQSGVVIITGGASGIGLGIARRAVQMGFRVCLVDVAPVSQVTAAKAELEQLVPRFSSSSMSPTTLPRIISVHADVTDLHQVNAALAAVRGEFGHDALISALFNNAGIQFGKSCFQEGERGVKQWRKALEVNMLGIVHCNHVFVPIMHRQNKPSVVVTTSSVSGLFNSFIETGAPYNASKFGATMIAECLQLELRNMKSKVKSALLCPGVIKTKFVENSMKLSSDDVDSKGNKELLQNFDKIPASFFLDCDEMVARFVTELESRPDGFYFIISGDQMQPRELLSLIVHERSTDITDHRPVVSRQIYGSPYRKHFKTEAKNAFRAAKLRAAL